ncbi:hypothetical protein PMIT1313_01664 [Prochlorococcus marinus str. MIT 1313]|nr:hypothetical protein PMIT1313_01664 [Prochlorococcus marinus str. MIT 1313]KZR71778.1 hypothetical protein PMIT1318_01586 [Prochlorococcus marinus str. MIT 1318]
MVINRQLNANPPFFDKTRATIKTQCLQALNQQVAANQSELLPSRPNAHVVDCYLAFQHALGPSLLNSPSQDLGDW